MHLHACVSVYVNALAIEVEPSNGTAPVVGIYLQSILQKRTSRRDVANIFVVVFVWIYLHSAFTHRHFINVNR